MFRGPYEWPVARVVVKPTLRSDLAEWLGAKWAWFKPRWIPVFVATLGALFLLAGTSYLSELAHHEDPVEPIATQFQSIKIVNGPAGASIQIVDTRAR